MFWLIILGAAFIGIMIGVGKQKLKENAKRAYQDSLANLKSDPANANFRKNTLELRRNYLNLLRDSKGNTIFDEVALMNDISAACAAAHQYKDSLQNENSANNINANEERLLNLQTLKEKGPIEQADYERRKQEIIALR